MLLPDPQNIHCPFFPTCSGCAFNKDANLPPVLKDVESFFKDLNVECNYKSDTVSKWRYRAKLAVRGSVENPLIGLFEAGTHNVISIPECRVHHPQINKAQQLITDWMVEQGIEPYQEATHQGVLRYLQFSVERSSGKVQLSLVLNRPNEFELNINLESLWSKQPDLWHSMWFNFNTAKNNLIFGPDWKLKVGAPWLWENIAGVDVCYHPANFAQANLNLFEVMLEDLIKNIRPKTKVIEYYAGVGVIAFAIASKVESVTCNEINPFAEEAFNESYKRLKNKQSLKLLSGNASEYLSLLQEADAVIIDPPRKGLEKKVLNAIKQAKHLKEFWYISCGWTSFKRDCLELQESWSVSLASAYLFFPGTDQVEILARFEPKT